jgi:phosphoribosyl 1,2-cyclic phosphodiesterase
VSAGDFSVKFWGVRGSIACSDPSIARYGGNTSALEVRCGPHVLCFDAGTGVRYLGNALVAGGKPLDLHLFLTHSHFDHVAGLPFFVPLFIKTNRVAIWAGHLKPEFTIKGAITELMMAPLFPVPPSVFQADVRYNDFTAGESIEPYPGVVVRTAPLNHPNRATGYRVDYAGKSICYITDTEHVIGKPDMNVVNLIRGADIVVYDSMYCDETFANHVGWGHSTWQEALRIADLAAVKTMVIFHHNPDHDDARMDKIAAEAGRLRPGTVVAREGLVLTA